jgi:hypothetical protein
MVESSLFARCPTPPNESAPPQTDTDTNLYNSPEYLAFYSQTLKHVEILKVIVSTFYREADGISLPLERSHQSGIPGTDGHKQTRKLSPADVQALLELEESLSAWHARLPEHLRAPPVPDEQLLVQKVSRASNEITKVYARQANVLQAR